MNISYFTHLSLDNFRVDDICFVDLFFFPAKIILITPIEAKLIVIMDPKPDLSGLTKKEKQTTVSAITKERERLNKQKAAWLRNELRKKGRTGNGK